MTVAQTRLEKDFLQEIRANLADPEPDFSMIPFWFWNDILDEEKIMTQLAEMLVKKIKAVCIHPMPDSFRKEDFNGGMPEEYLGPRFMECVRFAALQAKELGMKVWLYDEGGWPSGLALGQVVKLNPGFKPKTLHLNPKTGELSIAENPLRTDILNPGATKAFLEITYEKYKEAVGDLFGGTVTGIFTDEPNIAGHVGSLDIPWTEALPVYFRQMKGYDLMPGIRALYKNPGPDFEPQQIRKVRYDFCDAVSRLFAQSYFEPISQWCAANHIKLVGHLDRDHALAEHLFGGYSLPRLLQYYDIPGVDSIWRQIFPDKSGIDFPKFASSVAHTRNRQFALSESFGAYGFGLTFSQMKNMVDIQFVRGINLLVPHAFHYSSEGPRAFGVNSNVFMTDPRWSYFKEFSQYVSRLSFLMSRGRSFANVGLYYPIAGLWAKGGEADFMRTATGEFQDISNGLMQRQVEFDYIDEDAFLSKETTIQKGECWIGEGKYQCLILPKGSVGQIEVLNRMETFICSGGTMVFSEGSFSEVLFDEAQGKSKFLSLLERLMISQQSATTEKWGQGRVVFADAISLILDNKEIVPRCVDFSKPNSTVKVSRRVAEHYTVFLMVNESNQEQKVRVNFNCGGRAFVVDAENGFLQHQSPVSSGWHEVVLSGYDSRVILFDKINQDTANHRFLTDLKRIQRTSVFPVSWNCRVIRQYAFREGELISIPLNYELSEKAGPTPWLYDFKNSFSGTMEYIGLIMIPPKSENKKWILHFGNDVQDRMFRVWVNEKYAGSRAWGPFELDVSPFVEVGENRIRITVSNTLENLMTSESVVNDLKNLGWFNIYMKKISRMCSEG